MRKLIFSMHTSLDGFVAGPKGEMNWITINETLFDEVKKMTDQADTALYGRVTYEMMQSYWPQAGKQPNAGKHDQEHSEWYNRVSKLVLSHTLSEKEIANTKIISGQLKENLQVLKKQEGKNILIFGSPRAVQSLWNEGLIDEFWLFVNPVVLGDGIPLFKGARDITKLNLIEAKKFDGGVMALHYEKVQKV